ncbi:ferritin light chain-like [Erinaceus europaeus]|uniref:Ferritin light chain n=1 Tax=Erinaceus europaeus TaxID=9365 RepID=A0A1S3AFT3_ERIEU|nr:ferritin light chain-like [Erinaceus europaeus]
MQPHIRGHIFLGVDKVMEDTVRLYYHAYRFYSSMGLHLLKSFNVLEEVGMFLCELSEEKQIGYFRLLKFLKGNYKGDMSFPKHDRTPPKWKGVLSVMEYAINLEKELDQAVRILYRKASRTGKSVLCDLLRTHFLNGEHVQEQIQAHMDNV